MRTSNEQLLNALSVVTNQTSSAILTDYVLSVSAQAVMSGTPTGTLKLQGSNDLAVANATVFVPTNWTDIPVTSQTITAAGTSLIPKTELAYQYIRAVYTSTSTGVQTIAPIADTGALQTQTITTAADVAGSLNSTYFLLSSVNTTSKAQKNFYVWFNINSAGVDPAIAGKTAIPITGATNVSANTLATSIRSALNALAGDFTAAGSNAAVIVTNVAFGPVTAAVDGAAPTSFTFGTATLGIASNLNNTYFLLQDASTAHSYYVWNNVDTIGTDPAVAGRTGVPIAFASGATAATIGTALATAIGNLNSTNSFTATGTTTVTVTNKIAGPFTPASDVSTTFTFTVTTPTGTITARLKSIGF